MELSPNRLRLIVIIALGLIGVGAIVLLSIGGDGESGVSFPILDGSTTLRSFSGAELVGPTLSTDPCNLLGGVEVESELGMSVGDSQSGYVENPLGERFCRFPDPQNPDSDLVNISIVFNNSIDPALLNDDFNVKRMYKGRKVDPNLIELVNGVGDDAFWGGSGQELWNGFHVLINDIYLQIDVHSGDESLNYQAARNLAVIALERLFSD